MGQRGPGEHPMMHDLRFAFRQLVKAPGFTLAVLLTLAGGIGACVAIFSVVNGVLLRPLPYPESDRLVVIRESNPPAFPDFRPASAHYFEWKEAATQFEQLVAVRGGPRSLTGSSEPIRVRCLSVTPNYFAALHTPPERGRDFTAEDALRGNESVVVLSHGLWLRGFGARPDILEQSIQLDGHPFRVIGVMPQEFQSGDRSDVFTPLVWNEGAARDHRSRFFDVFGRLRSSASLESAQSEVARINEQVAAQNPDSRGWSVKVIPMLESRVKNVRPVLISVLGAGAFLLLIACTNVANLLLARATTRTKEIATRTALGASRGRIVRQLLVEAIVLAGLGGLLGLLVAHWGLGVLMSLAPEDFPRKSEVAFDGHTVIFALALSLLTGIVFGLVPAIQTARVDVNELLKDGGRGASATRRSQRWRGAVVVVQVAVTLVLLVGAGLLMRTFAALEKVDPGFQSEGALAVRISMPKERFATHEQRAVFTEQITQRLAALPGVTAVGASQFVPFMEGGDFTYFRTAALSATSAAELPAASTFHVTPDYFKAMRIPLIHGRPFESFDTAKAAHVAIVNETMARTYFGGDAIGKRISGGGDDWSEIVGVVGDVKQELDGEVGMQLYFPFAQISSGYAAFVLRHDDAVVQPDAVRSAIYEIDKNQAVDSLKPLPEWVAESISGQRFAMLLFGIFSGAALFLSVMGVYSVTGYAVTQREREFSIRSALGAMPRDIVRLVVLQSGKLIAVGIAAGLVGAFALARLLEPFLFGIGRYDPLTYGGIALLLLLVGGIAALVPARRATRIDLMSVLRAE
ncbi:ABC transporter permease [Pendulispora brunnea]|uniref:ABC transporter permease n=1 Tax=Pendulispora brunnea TaxID=2905690 RepID=A0ABZ2K640_9BACT